MKKRSLVVPTMILQAVTVLISIGALALMLWEPHIEGRNAHATLVEIYFKDPFLAYAYLASVPFFVALYQAFKVLGYIGENKAFSQPTVKALQTIKRCALAIIGSVADNAVQDAPGCLHARVERSRVAGDLGGPPEPYAENGTPVG